MQFFEPLDDRVLLHNIVHERGAKHRRLVSFSSRAFMSVSKLLIKNERALPLQKTTKVQKSSEVEVVPPSLIEM